MILLGEIPDLKDCKMDLASVDYEVLVDILLSEGKLVKREPFKHTMSEETYLVFANREYFLCVVTNDYNEGILECIEYGHEPEVHRCTIESALACVLRERESVR